MFIFIYINNAYNYKRYIDTHIWLSSFNTFAKFNFFPYKDFVTDLLNTRQNSPILNGCYESKTLKKKNCRDGAFSPINDKTNSFTLTDIFWLFSLQNKVCIHNSSDIENKIFELFKQTVWKFD